MRGNHPLNSSQFSNFAKVGVRLWLLLILLLISQFSFAGINVSLSKRTISLNETVDLLIAFDGQTQKNPSTRGLSKDFKILGTSQSTKVEFVNGVVSAKTNWRVKLKPKRLGKLTVPAISVEGSQSKPLSIKVHKARAAPKIQKQPKVAPKPKKKFKPGGGVVAPSATDVHIKTSLEPASPYLREMVIYTVRIFHATDLIEGELPDPVFDNALVRRLDPDKKYVDNIGKKRYKVIERRYAIFPQKSGKLTIPAPVLTAKVRERTAQGGNVFGDDSIFAQDPFFSQTPFGAMLQPTRPIQVKGKVESLEVKAPALEKASDISWLPAREVLLSESYDPDGKGVKVGDPIVREISLRVDGLTGSQIPEIEVAEVVSTNIYRDKPKNRTRGNKTGVLGDTIQKFTYVPTEAGELVIPALKIHWWDVVNDKAAVAKLPEKRISVLSKAGKTVNTKPVKKSPEKAKAKSESSQIPSDLDQTTPVAGSNNSATSNIWQWLAIALGILWLGTVALFWHKRARNHKGNTRTQAPVTTSAEPLSAQDARKKFEQACRANNPQQARSYLLKWAAAQWPENPPSGLTGISKRLKDKSAQLAVQELDLVLFNQQGKQWDGRKILKVLRKLPVKPRKNASTEGLPALY